MDLITATRVEGGLVFHLITRLKFRGGKGRDQTRLGQKPKLDIFFMASLNDHSDDNLDSKDLI